MKKSNLLNKDFNLTASLLNLWLIAGLFVDGWSHEHGKPLTSFFTPWHAFFYAGFFAVGFYTMFPMLIHFIKVHKIKFVYQSHYFSAVLGIIIFSVGGLGDVLWHGFYGFEKQIDAILSPTHLALYVGMFLIFIAPFIALSNQKNLANTVKNSITYILFIAIIFSFFTFLTQYANPLISPFPFSTHKTAVPYYGQTIGLISLFIHLAFLMAPLLLVLSRYRLPFGCLTFIFTLNAIGMTSIHDHFDFLITAIFAGVICDLILKKLHTTSFKSRNFLFVSFIIPFVYSAFYFLIGMVTRGIWWSGYLTLGAVLLSGFFGLVMALFMLASRK